MAVFVAFSDESECFGPNSEVFLGGYIAREDDWPWFARAWQERVLDGPPALPFLHMREINDPEWREKYGVKDLDVYGRIREASRVVRSFGNLAAVAGGIRRADLIEAFQQDRYRKRRHVPVGIDEPDYLAFLVYAYSTIHVVHRKWPEAQKVDFVAANAPHRCGICIDAGRSERSSLPLP